MKDGRKCCSKQRRSRNPGTRAHNCTRPPIRISGECRPFYTIGDHGKPNGRAKVCHRRPKRNSPFHPTTPGEAPGHRTAGRLSHILFSLLSGSAGPRSRQSSGLRLRRAFVGTRTPEPQQSKLINTAPTPPPPRQPDHPTRRARPHTPPGHTLIAERRWTAGRMRWWRSDRPLARPRWPSGPTRRPDVHPVVTRTGPPHNDPCARISQPDNVDRLAKRHHRTTPDQAPALRKPRRGDGTPAATSPPHGNPHRRPPPGGSGRIGPPHAGGTPDRLIHGHQLDDHHCQAVREARTPTARRPPSGLVMLGGRTGPVAAVADHRNAGATWRTRSGTLRGQGRGDAGAVRPAEPGGRPRPTGVGVAPAGTGRWSRHTCHEQRPGTSRASPPGVAGSPKHSCAGSWAAAPGADCATRGCSSRRQSGGTSCPNHSTRCSPRSGRRRRPLGRRVSDPAPAVGRTAAGSGRTVGHDRGARRRSGSAPARGEASRSPTRVSGRRAARTPDGPARRPTRRRPGR